MSTVKVKGSLFNGVADELLKEATHAALDSVAGQGLVYWMTNLDSSIRHPTPYYETQVHLEHVGEYRALVNDRGIIYGPWLEGVGSRNSPVTRFPGYHALRRAVTELRPRVHELAEHAVRPYVRKANG